MDAISGGFSAFTSQMNEIFQPIASGRQRERRGLGGWKRFSGFSKEMLGRWAVLGSVND